MTLVSPPVTWQPDRAKLSQPWAVPSLPVALGRGTAGRCPCCGESKLFIGYLRQIDACGTCGARIGTLPADDAPPYFTMLITGHIVVPLMLLLEKAEHPALWVHAAIFLPLTCVLVLGLLRPIKGATIGLLLRLALLKSQADA